MPHSITGRLGVDYAKRTTTPDFKVGTSDFDDANRTWVYVKASGAIAAAATVVVDASFNASSGAGSYTADAAFASGEFGWVRKTTTPL